MFAQTSNDPVWNIVSMFAFFTIFGWIYPRMMLHQTLWKLERDTRTLEDWSIKTTELVAGRMSKHNKKVKDAVSDFMNFFMVTPVDLDPSGIVKKLDRSLQDQKTRFGIFVETHSDEKDTEMRANLEDGLGGAWVVSYLSKIVRHYVEIVRKYKNPYIAIPIQMQLPMIMDFAKSYMKATESICNGDPIGDGIGPYVAAHLIGESEPVEIKEDEMVYAEKDINGRKCIITKAKGPGSRVGDPGKGMEKLMEKYKPTRVVTIDAAGKLEGEKLGGVAEGVGVAMGGPGVERFYIEEKTTKHGIPIDAVVVKMKPEEAILAMREEILDAAPKAIELVTQAVGRANQGENVIILGVGNTCGVGNNKLSLDEAEKKIRKNAKKLKKEEENDGKENKGFWDKINPFSSMR